jgi:putative oxidoreductase
MMDQSADMVYLLARVLYCGIWIMAGLFKLTHYSATVADMKVHHLPLAKYLLTLVLVLELVGSAMLISNTHVWAVALAWIAFTIPATMLYHWPIREQGAIVFIQLVQFGKNLSILGGLLALLLLDPTKPAWLRALLAG